MRTLAMLLGAAALSWAHVARADEAKQHEMGSMQEQTQQEPSTAQQMPEAQQQTGQKMEEMKEHARAAWPFEGKSNFDVEGKISKVSRDSVTLTREGLPAATLKVSKQTRIEVDGNTATIKQLKQGQDVKASFNLEGDKPLAVEIKAEAMK